MANTYNVCNKLQAIADAISQGGGGGGGTTVIANPSGTPTADLNTVQIGQVIYDIPGGGGGSGYTETTLWSGAPTTTSITLSDSVLNYDAIYCEGKFNNEAYMVETIDKATFTSYIGNDYISLGTHGGAYYGLTPASTATHFVFFGANYNGCTRVIGIKYARGGGSDEAVDINYDNTTSGLTATNVQDAIDENADNISTLNSKIEHSDYVSVTVTSGQTYRQVFDALYALADTTKINANSYVSQTISGGFVSVFKMATFSPSQFNFMWNTNSTYALSRRIVLQASGSVYSEASGGSTTSDKSTTAAVVGDVFELHY